MNQLTLNHVITSLGGGQSVTAFFLVLGRVTPLFVLAPLFSAKQIPAQVKGIVAVALTIGLYVGARIDGRRCRYRRGGDRCGRYRGIGRDQSRCQREEQYEAEQGTKHDGRTP